MGLHIGLPASKITIENVKELQKWGVFRKSSSPNKILKSIFSNGNILVLRDNDEKELEFSRKEAEFSIVKISAITHYPLMSKKIKDIVRGKWNQKKEKIFKEKIYNS